jgi:hypothetical protein
VTISENPRITDVLLFEKGEEVNFVRETITLAAGGAAVVIGQVLGGMRLGGVGSVTETHVGNTGNGVFTPDGATPSLVNAPVGVYTVTFLTATHYRVFDPLGREIGEGDTGVVFADLLKFSIAAGGAAFVAGDKFLVTVGAGSGKYAAVAAAAADGTQVATAVAIEAGNPAVGDVQIVAVVRAPAIFKVSGLVWPAGITAPQKAVAIAQLAALGMTVRSDYGF